MKSTLYLLSMVVSTSAVCFCPYRCVNKGCSQYDVVTCNDIESRDECHAANAEVTDMVNSMGKNADLFLLAAADDNLLTPLQASRLRTHLSAAFEESDAKPVGDCQAGLSTQSRIKGTKSHCFSPSLLTECKKIKDRIHGYATTIYTRLRNSIMSASDSRSLGLVTSEGVLLTTAAQFVTSVQRRGELSTAVIRCASYEETIAEIEASAVVVPSLLALVLCLLSVL